MNSHSHKYYKSRTAVRDFFLLIILLLSSLEGSSKDSLTVKQKVLITAGIETVSYTSMMIGLDKLWYAGYPRSKFHLFNDNQEWLQMDKFGHFGSCYYLGWMGYETVKWTGIEDRKAIWWGGMTGFLFLTVIETLDGFSSEWGASPGDLIANTSGTAMFVSQQLIWDEQRVILKFSHTPSPYAVYRPEALGSNYMEQLLKDYNAQTYWVSVNPASFKQKQGKLSFLNIALGYSGDGMTGGDDNPLINSAGEIIPYFDRGRQVFLGLDIDLRRIKTKNKVLRNALKVVNVLKIPSPTIEYHSIDGFKWNWLTF